MKTLRTSDNQVFKVSDSLIKKSKFLSKTFSGAFGEQDEVVLDNINGYTLGLVLDVLKNNYKSVEESSVSDLFVLLDVFKYLDITEVPRQYYLLIRKNMLEDYPNAYFPIYRKDMTLFDAIIESNFEAVQYLLDQGLADPNKFEGKIMVQNIQIKDNFIEPIVGPNNVQPLPLHLAVDIYTIYQNKVEGQTDSTPKEIEKAYKVVEVLLKIGADPNKLDQVYGSDATSLKHILNHENVILDNDDIIQLLFKYGADPNVHLVSRNRTVFVNLLKDSIRNRDHVMAKALIDYGIDLTDEQRQQAISNVEKYLNRNFSQRELSDWRYVLRKL